MKILLIPALLSSFSGFTMTSGNGSEVDSLKALFLKTKDPKERAGLMYDLGHAYFGFNKDSAIIYLDGAYQYYSLIKNDTMLCKTSATLCMGYLYIDPAKSAKYAFESLEIAEKVDDPKLLAYTYNIVGTHYRVVGEWDKAKEYFDKVIVIRENLKDTLGIAMAYNNLGIIHMLKAEYELGLQYWKDALDLKLQIGEELSAAYSMANIAIYYKDIGRYLEAKEYAETALEIESRLKDYEGVSHSLTILGENYLLLNNYSKSIDAFEQALAFCDSLNTDYDRLDPLMGLSKAYEKSGQFKKSTEILREYIEVLRKQNDEAKQRTANEMRTKYEAEKKEKENLLLKSENDINQAKLKEEEAKNQLQEANNRLLIIGLGFVLFVLVVIIIFLRRVRSAKKEIELQKNIVEVKNQEITDSISYAKRLQEAILPPDEILNECFREHFVLYLPKDIVAGDFYWMEKVGDKVLIAAADCTGHGVPGAMVSVVCFNALNRAIRELGLIHPGEILDKVTDLVIETFERSQEEVKDGMDIALCLFDFKNGTMEFAGANNSVYYVRDNVLNEIKPTKQPIGKYADRVAFENHRVEIKKDDMVFLFTDGYADQFGGDNGKKLKYKPFKDLLSNNSNETLKDQKENLRVKFEDWKGEFEQVDDVCVLGIRV